MFCPQCGASFNTGDRFCVRCGKPLPAPDTAITASLPALEIGAPTPPSSESSFTASPHATAPAPVSGIPSLDVPWVGAAKRERVATTGTERTLTVRFAGASQAYVLHHATPNQVANRLADVLMRRVQQRYPSQQG